MAAETDEKIVWYFRTVLKVIGYLCVFLLGFGFGFDDGGSPKND